MDGDVIHLKHFRDHQPLCWRQDEFGQKEFEGTFKLEDVTCQLCKMIMRAD